ncbi:MAG: flavodoxin domain-containing protein [Bacteroidales bacterium]|jgi:menaquinone-dependent protoporphyrinogen oxidase|nr:flavodoxin domain-containing protein [Bacteroidales bacterium]
MKIAIIYTSKYGTTAKMAQNIASQLAIAPQMQLYDLKNGVCFDLTPFDTIVLGTPIYAGQPLKLMKQFCKINTEQLMQKRLLLFVCGMEKDNSKRQQEIKNAYPEQISQHADCVCFTGGEFIFEKMNFIERLIIKKIAKIGKNIVQTDKESIQKIVDCLNFKSK